ncbi:unnamed protein product [Litomosoides sigmodontis]|uniref:Vitellogenin domain-containing protein n=1 Tax=Litomosoides sigmodontis TaxID=42156 RepID=A0A3P6TCI3_LITSI|nr:unnamed protein product [Litomosoides sigmodontis]
MHLGWLLPFQAVITLAADNKHHAASDDRCAVECTGVSSEVKYDVGRSYVFEVRSRTTLKINEQRDTDVIQSAHAHISVHSSCEFSLKLTQTRLEGMNVGGDWSAILERSSLRFAFDDGEVKAICPHNTDPIWAVNIKRAILSAFQTKHALDQLKRARETDVSGDCPVSIERQKTNEILNLKTTKQLNACYRDRDIAGVRTIPYRMKSKIQVSPMMESKQICERQIARDNLQYVNCIEDYSLTSPFGEESLGLLHVEQTLRAIGIENARSMELFSARRSSLIFDHSDDNFNTQSSAQHAKKIIDELCKSNDRINPDAAYYFGDLISNLRGLSMMEISSIANFQCDGFIDALAACGSHACLQQFANLINSGHASQPAYSSLTLLTNPKEDSMNAIAAFIENVPLHGLLPISSLVQSYCIAHPTCAAQTAIQHIIRSILSKLPSDCSVGEQFEEIKKAIVILKSIGNIGYEEHSLATILACIRNEQISHELKIAAIDALRRKPCSEQRNSKITELFRDPKVDIEVRIKSFRQLMECVNDEILQIIIEQLHNETINQVGSYVWSYLNGKQRSTNPGSRNLQYMLKRFHISQRYNLDLNRFSRYYELGYFDKENNYGGHMDTSVLLVPKSYIPREVSFNFTAHFFGKSINLLEIGVRSDGLEKAEEELFGPDGYVSNPNGHVFREKQFQSRYSKLNRLQEIYRRRMNGNTMRVTCYIRMFGDDLYYYGFQMDQEQLVNGVKESIELDKVLAKLVEEKVAKLSRYMLLYELSKTLPTLSGLSLQFSTNLSLATKINGKLRLNMMDVLVGKTNANGFLKLHPSISIARGGAVVLRAGHVVSGALLTSKFHAATSVVQSIEMNERRKLLLRFDVPHKDILIAKIRNDITKIESNQQQPFISTRHIGEAVEKHYCSGDTLAKILGIRACLNVHANFPMLEGSVEIRKVDDRLNSYQLLIERNNDSGEQKLLVSIDTPGSRINRKIETDIEISIPRKKFKVGIVAPFKTIVLDGNLQQMQQSQDYATNLQLLVDDKTYSLDGIVKATKMEERNLYKLNAKSVAESVTTAEVTVELQYSAVRPYSMVNFHLDKIFQKPITFQSMRNSFTNCHCM